MAEKDAAAPGFTWKVPRALQTFFRPTGAKIGVVCRALVTVVDRLGLRYGRHQVVPGVVLGPPYLFFLYTLGVLTLYTPIQTHTWNLSDGNTFFAALLPFVIGYTYLVVCSVVAIANAIVAAVSRRRRASPP